MLLSRSSAGARGWYVIGAFRHLYLGVMSTLANNIDIILPPLTSRKHYIACCRRWPLVGTEWAHRSSGPASLRFTNGSEWKWGKSLPIPPAAIRFSFCGASLTLLDHKLSTKPLNPEITLSAVYLMSPNPNPYFSHCLYDQPLLMANNTNLL